MRDLELAWVAGYLEGEGCFQHMKCSKGRFGVYYYPRISSNSIDLDILQRLQRYSGIGGIAGPRQQGSRKPQWQWTASKSRQAAELMEAIYPFMGQRRRTTIDEILDSAGRSKSLRIGSRTLDHFAWVVGFLEAEGSFYWMTLRQGKYGPYYYPRVGAGSTDRDVIELLPQYTGLGQITGPYHRKAPRKSAWHWTITNKEDAVAFMEAVHPQMCSRRQARIQGAVILGVRSVRPSRFARRRTGERHIREGQRTARGPDRFGRSSRIERMTAPWARITEVLNFCGRETDRRRPSGQLEFIDLVPIEEGKLSAEGEREEPDEARLYNQPLTTPPRPERGRS